MSEKLARIIEKIEQAEAGVLSTGMRRGLEKESLRIDAEGVFAATASDGVGGRSHPPFHYDRLLRSAAGIRHAGDRGR